DNEADDSSQLQSEDAAAQITEQEQAGDEPAAEPVAEAAPAGVPAEPVTAEPETSAAVTQPAEQSAAASGNGLVITFSANCWVQVSVPGGRILHSGQMGPGQTLNIDQSGPLDLVIGAADAVSSIEYKGQPVQLNANRQSGVARLRLGQEEVYMHHESPVKRRKSRHIRVGSALVGGDAPISVQSMTNTDTCVVAATVGQIRQLEAVGAAIVRVSVPTMEAAEAFGQIRQQVKIPLVADIHFDYKIALRVADLGVDCLRINPGNIGREDRIRQVVDAARHHGIPIRIGVNAGSLEKDLQKKYGEPTPEALLESALRHVEHFDRLDFQDFKVSVKASDVFMAVGAYRLLAQQIEQPLHLGITEAGGLRSGTVKSAVGLGMLLAEGIGDTIRISLAADPVEEI